MGEGPRRRAGEPASKRSGAVLIVDDDASVRKAIVHMLGLGGFPALEAASGREGIDALGRDPGIALVLLDLNMNPMDGRTFRQLQLADPKLAIVPTVVLTGAPLADVDDATLMADDYLLKPVGREHLLSVVSAYCIAGR
ncbi:MAG: response regulator [Vicinamibacterales bacterium]